MKILMLDNYDSFTYNVVHIIRAMGHKPDVFRNDKISLEAMEVYDKIILSPGPGVPDDAGLLKDCIKTYGSKKSILGICLGLQAITEVYGGSILNLKKVYHGISTPVNILQKTYLFEGLPNTIEAARYHSWVANPDDFPADLEITAVDEQKEIMAIQHKTYDVHGVQFHPESIMTKEGPAIIQNFLNH